MASENGLTITWTEIHPEFPDPYEPQEPELNVPQEFVEAVAQLADDVETSLLDKGLEPERAKVTDMLGAAYTTTLGTESFIALISRRYRTAESGNRQCVSSITFKQFSFGDVIYSFTANSRQGFVSPRVNLRTFAETEKDLALQHVQNFRIFFDIIMNKFYRDHKPISDLNQEA